MDKEYAPHYNLSNEILKQLTEISSMEGQLKATKTSTSNRQEISYLANIDSVHFSTKLEGNMLTHKQVTELLSGKSTPVKSQRDLKEIVNYAKARSVLFDKATQNNTLSKALILKVHHILMNRIVSGKLKGYFRDSQNVIKDAKSRKIVYLPPEAPDVGPLMKRLIRWVQKSLLCDLSPYIVAAIFHYAFVTIHPFMDGNGRTARLLSSYILLSNNIYLPEYASLEKQHENHRRDYYHQLRQRQSHTHYDIPKDIDLTSWISYFLTSLHAAYEEGLAKLGVHVTPETIHLDHRLEKALSLFKKHRQLKASEYEVLMGLGRTQAVNDLNQLIKKNLVSRIGGGRSSVYKLNT